jgi:hypothetical protein
VLDHRPLPKDDDVNPSSRRPPDETAVDLDELDAYIERTRVEPPAPRGRLGIARDSSTKAS